MRKILSSFFILPFFALSFLSAEEMIQVESNHFKVSEDSLIAFLTQSTLNTIDQDIDQFLTHFQLSLDEKFGIQIYLDKDVSLENVTVSEAFGPMGRFSKLRWIDVDRPKDPATFALDVEKARWIALQCSFEFLFEGKIGEKGHNGNFLVFAYLRNYFLDSPVYPGLRDRIREQIEKLLLDKNNFTLAPFAVVPQS